MVFPNLLRSGELLLKVGDRRGDGLKQNLVAEQGVVGAPETVVGGSGGVFLAVLVNAGQLLAANRAFFRTEDEVLHVGVHIVPHTVDDDRAGGTVNSNTVVAVEQGVELRESRGRLDLEVREDLVEFATVSRDTDLVTLLVFLTGFAEDTFFIFETEVDSVFGISFRIHRDVIFSQVSRVTHRIAEVAVHVAKERIVGVQVAVQLGTVSGVGIVIFHHQSSLVLRNAGEGIVEFLLGSLVAVDLILPCLQGVFDLSTRNIVGDVLDGFFEIGDVSEGLGNLGVVVLNGIGIVVFVFVPGQGAFSKFLLGLGELGLQFEDLVVLVDDGFTGHEVNLGGFDDGLLLSSGQVLSGELDVAKGNAQGFLSLGEFLLLLDQIDLVILGGDFHRFLDRVDLGLDLLGAEGHLHRHGVDFELLEFTVQSFHLRESIGLGLDLVGRGLLYCCLSQFESGLCLAVDTVLRTQLSESVIVTSLGFAEGKDAVRLNLLDTGSEKTAGSNHNHQ